MNRPVPARLPGRPLMALLPLLIVAAPLLAGCAGETGGPSVRLSIEGGQEPRDVAAGLQLLILLTVLSMAPAALIMTTAFTRIVIVLSLTRTAIGVNQLPPNQVVLGLALFLTLFVMAPTWSTVNDQALQPYLAGEISQPQALQRAEQPVRDFMLRQTREKDLALFVHLARIDRPRGPSDVPTHVLIPAFVISELRTAFEMGFAIFVPFLIIDLVVSSVLMAMGMMMLPPTLMALPFKVLLFVMVDGWHLLAQSLVLSFG